MDSLCALSCPSGNGEDQLHRDSVGIARAPRLYVAATALLCLLGCYAVFTATAAASETPPELFWQVPGDEQPGSGAERMSNPRGVAASPTTGNVFVIDLNNARVVEFTAWGEFVKAWGFGVKDGSPALQVCTTATGCQAGIKGSAPGQLSSSRPVAVDSAGFVYVYDGSNNRVTKYSEDGEFLLMFGGNVNKTTGAEVCTAADVKGGDECGAGATGNAPGFFENGTVGNYIAAGPSGTIFVGDKGRIQGFNSDGTFKAQIPFTGELAALAGATVFNLAVDPVSSDLYFDTNANEDLYRISATGELREVVEDTVQMNSEAKTFPVNPAGLAVDSGGNLYVVDHRLVIGFNGPFEVLKFSPSGACLICGAKFAQPDSLFVFGQALMGLATSDACGIPGDDLYVTVFNGFAPLASYVQSYGPSPQDVEKCPPLKVAPDITDQYAVGVGIDDAEVEARINPRFWNDTTYYVQYGSQECLDSEWQAGCSTEPLPPGPVLTTKVLNRPVATDEVTLKGLEPDTVYHYRFVADSSGGGPVIGVGGTESEEGASASFRTFPGPLPLQSDCPNQEFRIDASAFLPECRALEMVSPVDKNGGDIATQDSIKDYPAELDLSAADGESVTYSSSSTFAGAVSAPYSSQYIARRDPKIGWQTEAISPPREVLLRPAGKAPLFELDLQFKLFSPDLGQTWLMHEADPPLDGCAVPGFINWYRRDNSSGAYEAITTVAPPTVAPLSYFSEVQGTSADGTHTIFKANDKLTPDAASSGGYQLYEHIREPEGCGETRLVSVLPGGAANSAGSTAGTGATGTGSAGWIEARENLVHNAVSTDGSLIYWSASSEGQGQIYLRIDGTETIPVSAGAARFWSAAANGSFAYYTEGENLFRFSFATKSATPIAPQTSALLGASEDGSRAYFVSKKDLAGAAVEGEPNVYLFDEGSLAYIATLSLEDVTGSFPFSTNSPSPASRSSLVSEDGSYLAFTSNQSLTGHDNVDADSDLRDSMVFLYEAGPETLRCLSCNVTDARPTGRVLHGSADTKTGFAARILPWKNQFHAPRTISPDGSRVYFESLERLVPRDQNGKLDVYTWRRAASESECVAIGAELFSADAGGCISLISSGTGDGDSEFVDSTPDGSDVFFKTNVSLVAQDPGRIDLYDARVGGGFAPPPEPVCEDEDCQEKTPVKEPPPPTPPGSGKGDANPDLSACGSLERKAQKLRAKARKLQAKARKADPAKARELRAKANKSAKKAKQLNTQAQRCYTGGR